MKPTPSDSPYFVEALARGLDVLGLFSREQPSLTLSDVVEITGLSKATAYRILWTLEATGYLVRDTTTKRYKPDMKVLTLGFAAINNIDIRQIAHPHLEALSHDLDLTTSLGILHDLSVIYIDRVRNRAIVGVLLGIGDQIPVNCSSMGKVILAFLPATERDERLSQSTLAPCTSATIQNLDQFKQELTQVYKQGYALNNEELYSGLRAVAAPIINGRGEVIAAINASGGRHEIDDERLNHELPKKVVMAAQKISQTVKLMTT